jgi:hypothetical protein
MTTHRTLTAVVLVAAGAWAPHVLAQTTSTDLEVGLQWVDVSGNEDMYRTQLNDRDGLVIRDLSVLIVDTEGEVDLFDRLRLDASGFGGSPAGRLRLSSDLGGLYSFRLQYMRYDLFSAVPGWANPAEGSSPSLHRSDRDRHLLDLEVELLPGKAITPIVGYRWNKVDGPRSTTYHVGQDEFRLASDLEETESEVRVGFGFRAGTFRGALVQGWRRFEARERSWLAPGAEGGLNSRPVLGTDVVMDQHARTTETDAETPVTSIYASGTLIDRIRLDLTYVRADTETDTTSDEALSGSLVSYRISRFFSGFEQSIESRTDNPTWRGALRAGIDLTRTLSLDLGYERRHRELEGWALISSLYLDTLNFSGADPGDVLDLVRIENGYDRDDETVDLTLRATELGPFHLWAGWSTTDTSLDLEEDLAQIVVPGGQSGSYERQVDSYDLGAGLTLGPVKVLVDYVADDGDQSVMRTDFLDRSRIRGRIDWSPLQWLTLLATAEHITASNDTPGIDLDADTDHWALDLGLEPVDDLWFRIAWDRYETESTFVIRRPQDLGVESQRHLEDAELLDTSLELRLNRSAVALGYSTLSNTGSLAFDLDRFYGRFAYDIGESWGASVEYESNDYSESVFASSGFDASRYAVFVHWRQ